MLQASGNGGYCGGRFSLPEGYKRPKRKWTTAEKEKEKVEKGQRGI
jgi:hypothetical protein